ncbi:MAG TPA: VUT family protein [Conexibacter sp.]|nr:VUT family protein [Conexibacter sp.]
MRERPHIARIAPAVRTEIRPARAYGPAALTAYVTTIGIANLLLAEGVFVDLGLGLVAPAATFAVGLTFTLRDVVQTAYGKWAALAAIVLGSAISALVAPAFVLASTIAFLVSELADLAVYTPLAQRNRIGAVALSNTVGLAVDSWLFLTLAFGSLALLPGLIVCKALMTVLVVAAMWAWRGRRGVLAGHA